MDVSRIFLQADLASKYFEQTLIENCIEVWNGNIAIDYLDLNRTVRKGDVVKCGIVDKNGW